MKTIVFLLEEPSARDLIAAVVPRVVTAPVDMRFVVFQGKSDLEKNLVRKIRLWKAPNSVFVVLRDQDGGDCHIIKKTLVELVSQTQRADRTVVRIACRDLDSWVLGDWKAVADAFSEPMVANHGRKAKYRNPDLLSKPVSELKKFIPSYQKGDGARRVGPLMEVARNQSPSFRVFGLGILRLLASAAK